MKLLFLAGWLSKSSRLPLSDKKLFFFLKEPVCSYMTEVWKIPALSKKCRSTSVMICYHRKKNCRMRYQTFTWRMNRAAHQRCYRIPTKWHIIHRSSLYLMATALIVGEVILKFFLGSMDPDEAQSPCWCSVCFDEQHPGSKKRLLIDGR